MVVRSVVQLKVGIFVKEIITDLGIDLIKQIPTRDSVGSVASAILSILIIPFLNRLKISEKKEGGKEKGLQMTKIPIDKNKHRESGKKKPCPHKNTVAINEQGHAGIYCPSCGEQLEKEC